MCWCYFYLLYSWSTLASVLPIWNRRSTPTVHDVHHENRAFSFLNWYQKKESTVIHSFTPFAILPFLVSISIVTVHRHIGSRYDFHHHRKRMTMLVVLRSERPSPPQVFRVHTVSQFISDSPFLFSSELPHRHCLLTLSIHLMSHWDSRKNIKWYTSIEESTDWTSWSLPPFEINFPFQLPNFFSFFLLKAWTGPCLVSPPIEVGQDREMGNCFLSNPTRLVPKVCPFLGHSREWRCFLHNSPWVLILRQRA